MKSLSPNIIKFYIWKFVGGFYFLYPLQAIWPLSKGVTMPQLALYLSATRILSTLFEIPTGFVADRISRKLSVSLGFLFSGLGYIGLIFIHDFYSLLPLSAIFALGIAFNSGAEDSLIYDELKSQSQESTYLHVSSRGGMMGMLSGAIASFTGTILYTINFALPFILSAIANFILVIFVFTFKETKVSHEVSERLKIFDGVKNIIKSKSLVVIAGIEILLLLFVNIFYQILFYPRINHLGLAVKYLGTLDVINISLSSLMLYLLPRLVFKKDKTNFIFLTLLTALLFIIFSNSSQLVIAILFGVLFDIVWTARIHVIPTITNKFFESHNRALSLSSMSFISNIGVALLLPFATFLFGINYLFTIIPAALIIIILYFYPKDGNKAQQLAAS